MSEAHFRNAGIFLLVALVAGLIVTGTGSTKEVLTRDATSIASAQYEAGDLPLSGWAWGADARLGSSAGGLGWVSFSCTDRQRDYGGFLGDVCGIGGGRSSYGVGIDEAADGSGRRYLSGYAWSDNYGWLNFGCSSTPGSGACFGQGEENYPAGGSAQSRAYVDSTGNMKGWARFCAVFNSGCSGTFAGGASTIAASTVLGDWDGWVSLSDSGSLYGVALDDILFKNYAWGADTVGWIKFDPCGGGGPTCRNVQIGTEVLGASCASDKTVAQVGETVTWEAYPYGGSPNRSFAWYENGLRMSGTDQYQVSEPYVTPGNYSREVEVTDTSTGLPLKVSCMETLLVIKQVSGFGLAANPSTIELPSGTGASSRTTITVINDPDYTGAVTLSATLLSPPTGVDIEFDFYDTSDGSDTIDSELTSAEFDIGREMEMTVLSGAVPPGNYDIEITGSGGGLVRTRIVSTKIEGTGLIYEEI